MKNSSKVIATGIIKKIDFNSNILDIVRPTAEIMVYNEEEKEWVDKIYLIFSDNANARKFRGFHVGDIILISGELIYYSGVGYAVYVLGYTVLQNNKNESPLNVQKTLFFNYIGAQNFIFINGCLLYKDAEIATLSHSIDTNIRGDLVKKSIQPVRLTKKIKKASKNVVFIGHFTTNLIAGEVYETV